MKRPSPRDVLGRAGRSIRAGPDHDAHHLDDVVRSAFGCSWGQARRWISRGKVFVKGEAIIDPLAIVRAGDEVSLRLDAPRPLDEGAVTDAMVVHIDRQVLVVAKPSGIATVPHDEGVHGTLIDELRRYLSRRSRARSASKRRSPLPPLHVVQRLDRGTSGLLVFARTLAAAESLRDQFKHHDVHRRYLALVHGHVVNQTIRSHLVDDRGDGRRGSRERAPRRRERDRAGKLAITHLTVEERFSAPEVSLVRCRLETGRTHQIRIHLSEIGHPVLGERHYIRGYRGVPIEAPRLMLHAGELGFRHPATRESMRFELPLPDEMAEMIKRLRRGGAGS